MPYSTNNTCHFSFSKKFKDPKVEQLLMDMAVIHKGSLEMKIFDRDSLREFGNQFTTLEYKDITWLKLCEIADITEKRQYAIFLLYLLMKDESWGGIYRESLEDIYPAIKGVVEEHIERMKKGDKQKTATTGQRIFCHENITRLVCFRNRTQYGCISSFQAHTDNRILKLLIQDFLSTRSKGCIYNFMNFEANEGIIARAFSEFIPDFNTDSVITEKTFWDQIRFVLGFDDAKTATRINMFFNFYKYLADTHMPDIYRSMGVINRMFMEDVTTPYYLKRGYFFTEFSAASIDRIKDKTKVVFILRGYDRLYNSIESYDFKAVDCSSLLEKRYLPLFWHYFLEDASPNNMHFNFYISNLIEALNIVTSMKSQPGYPCPDPTRITRAECIAIRTYGLKNSQTYSKQRAFINTARAFFRSGEAKGVLSIEPMALSKMQVRCPETINDTNETIPPEVMARIIKVLEDRADKGCLISLELLVIVKLLLTTEHRISFFCALKLSDLKEGAKDGEWYIEKISKTSHGKKLWHVITEDTAKLLKRCIEATKEIRESVTNPLLSDYIFIFKMQHLDRYQKMTALKFKTYLNKFLGNEGFGKRYSVMDFRNTHMTKAIQYCIANNRTEQEKGLLTSHRSVDTTLTHYYDSEASFRELLEDTYDIEISADLTIPGGIAADVPDTADSVVENGCGNCLAEHCLMRSNLPCLLCRNFITTPKHSVFFEESIRMLSKEIEASDDEHVIDDLKTRKAILVLYLEKIHEFKKKEEEK